MADEIFCSEAWARFNPAEVTRLGAGSYALERELAKDEERATMCQYLPQGVVPVDDAAAVRTDTPGLWLVGDGDPQDPPANLAGVPAQQPNSRIVVMPAQQHVIGHLGCMAVHHHGVLGGWQCQGAGHVVCCAGVAGPAFPSGVSLNPPMFSFVTGEVGRGSQRSPGGIRVLPVRDLRRRQASNQPTRVDTDTSGTSPV